MISSRKWRPSSAKKHHASDKVLIITNEFRFSIEINKYLTPQGSKYLGANAAKKLNKLYQEFQKAKAQHKKASLTAFSEFQDKMILDDGTWINFKQERKQETEQEIGERVRLFSRDVIPLTGAAAAEEHGIGTRRTYSRLVGGDCV